MKKLRKMISALALSASLLLTGCAGTLNPPMPGADGGQQTTQAAQGTQGTTSRNEVGNVSQSNATTPTMDLNGYSVTVADAVYCVTDNGDMVVMSGEYDGVYVLLMFASTASFKANTSFSRSDFGSTMELIAALVEPSSGLVISDSSQSGITGASFSVTDISDSNMNISMSATVTGYDLTFDINASGTVTLTDLETCAQIISEMNDLAVSSQSSSSGGGGQPFTCPGCKGSRECHYCNGKGTCPDCLGLLDHCLGCGGTNVCRFCHGTTICHHCNGEGVMY